MVGMQQNKTVAKGMASQPKTMEAEVVEGQNHEQSG